MGFWMKRHMFHLGSKLPYINVALVVGEPSVLLLTYFNYSLLGTKENTGHKR